MKRKNYRRGNRPGDLARHHRHLNGWDGKKSGEIISWVRRDRHVAWHILFRNLTPTQIVPELKSCILCFYIKTSPYIETDSMERKRRAWEFLFKNKTLKEIILEINSVWLDYRNPIVIKEKTELKQLVA